jgi:RHS repeat-associated protein
VAKRDGTWYASYRYRAYGALLDSAGSVPFRLRYRWIGREFDEETGLYYVRARYYDPNSQRFTQEDPIGFAGGSNVYAYGDGNPTNGRDLDGMSKDPDLTGSDPGDDWFRACMGTTGGCGGGGGVGSINFDVLGALAEFHDQIVLVAKAVRDETARKSQECGCEYSGNVQITARYGHLSAAYITAGKPVVAGQAIGAVGCGGLCTAPHLHFELLVNGEQVDPRYAIPLLPHVPVDEMTQGSGFGMRFHPILHRDIVHEGVDLGATYGSPVYAVDNGVIRRWGRIGGYGLMMEVDYTVRARR